MMRMLRIRLPLWDLERMDLRLSFGWGEARWRERLRRELRLDRVRVLHVWRGLHGLWRKGGRLCLVRRRREGEWSGELVPNNVVSFWEGKEQDLAYGLDIAVKEYLEWEDVVGRWQRTLVFDVEEELARI
jgi:hypothetical protein